ncbi:MAG: transposase [Candidatus Thorarchaeota archaeon]
MRCTASSYDDGHRPDTSPWTPRASPSHPSGGEWLSVRMERTRKRRFTALHAVVDTGALMFLAVIVRTHPGGDTKEFIPLLEGLRHQSLEYVYTDRAYHFRKNVQYVCDIGVYPAIEAKRGLSGRAKRGTPWVRGADQS